MDLGLKGKTAIVTGSGSQIGYGKGIALRLAKEGCNVIVVDIDLEGAKKTAAEVEALGVKAMAVKCDISDRKQVLDLVKTGTEKFGQIDILVNNAGTTRNASIVDATDETYHFNVDVNMKGGWYLAQAVTPQMMARKSGKIVSISSAAAYKGFDKSAQYGMAKGGVVGMTINMAVELGPYGINVNAIAPGLGDTGLIKLAGVPEAAKGFVAKSLPLRRLTTPQDIGNSVAFLVSDVSSDMTGQVLHVDGGDIMR